MKVHELPYKSLSEVVADEIRNKIWRNELNYGDRILEVDMAEQFGISRSTLREALRLLEHEKLIITQNRKGSFVNDFNKRDADELKEIRLLLEGPALIQASHNLNQTHEKELEDILNRFKIRLNEDNWFEAYNLDRDFHLYLVSLCDNSRIIDVYHTLLVQIRTIIPHSYEYYADKKELYFKTHMEVYEAVKSKDELLIQETIKKHIKFDS